MGECALCVSTSGEVTIMNDDDEHLEFKPYDGKDDDDNELDPVSGDGAKRLLRLIRSLQMKYELNMK